MFFQQMLLESFQLSRWRIKESLWDMVNRRCYILWRINTHSLKHTHTHKHPSVVCWWKWYIKSLCKWSLSAGLRVWLTCVWQASHGRWGQTADTTTNTNRRNPFCASTGADTRWVSHQCAVFPPHGNLTLLCMQMQVNAVDMYCMSPLCFCVTVCCSSCGLPGQCGAQL